MCRHLDKRGRRTGLGSAVNARTLVTAAIAVATLLLSACSGSTVLGHASTTSAASSRTGTSGTPPSASESTSTSTPTSTSTANEGTAPDTCTLINRQNASTAIGSDAGAPSGGGPVCTYQTPGGSVTVFATQDGSAASSLFDGARSAATGIPGFQDVTGVGDRAFITLDKGSGLIKFVKGPIVVSILVARDPLPSADAMTALGRAAAGRM